MKSKVALAYIEKIDSLGGMLRAIESGFVQTEIQKPLTNTSGRLNKKSKWLSGE